MRCRTPRQAASLRRAAPAAAAVVARGGWRRSYNRRAMRSRSRRSRTHRERSSTRRRLPSPSRARAAGGGHSRDRSGAGRGAAPGRPCGQARGTRRPTACSIVPHTHRDLARRDASYLRRQPFGTNANRAPMASRVDSSQTPSRRSAAGAQSSSRVGRVGSRAASSATPPIEPAASTTAAIARCAGRYAVIVGS